MEKHPETSRSDTFFSVFGNMHRKLMTLVQTTATNNNLSMSQYFVLMSISHQVKITQKQLGDESRLPKSTLSQAIEGLVSEGILIRQHVKGSRRDIQLVLTQKGKNFVQDIYEQPDGVQQIFQKSVETLSEDQFSDFMRTYEHIMSNLDIEGRDQHAENI